MVCLPALFCPVSSTMPMGVQAAPDSTHAEIARFEQDPEFPLRMPAGFYRQLSESGSVEGFPPYGGMYTDCAVPRNADCAFRFDLEGGSMGIATAPGFVATRPGALHEVTCRVRTTGLEHAAVRMSARFHDADDRPVTGSEVLSSSVRTSGDWTSLEVQLDSEPPVDGSIVVQLQLLQPRQLGSTMSPEGTWSDVPMIEDISGSAWFDDLAVTYRPRLDLSTGHPGEVVPSGTPMPLVLDVTGMPGTHDIVAHVRVHDILRRQWDVYRGSEVGNQPKRIEIPLVEPGSYEVIAQLIEPSGRVLQETTLPVFRPGPVEHLEQDEAPEATTRFGVVIDHHTGGQSEQAIMAMDLLDPGVLVLPVLANESAGRFEEDEFLDRVREYMYSRSPRPRIIAHLDRLPPPVAAELHLDEDQVIEFMGMESAPWHEPLARWLSRLGCHVQTWLIGTPGDPVDPANLPMLLDIQKQLAKLSPESVLLVPWDIQQPPPEAEGIRWLVSLDAPDAKADLKVLVDQWRHVLDRTTLVLDPAGEDPTGLRVSDALIDAWSTGIDCVLLHAPWSGVPGDEPINVDPAFMPCRVLGHAMASRAPAGDYRMVDGTICMLADGPGGLLMVVRPPDESRVGEVRLPGSGSVRSTCMDGSSREHEPESDGVIRIPVDDAPVLLTGIDPGVAMLRASVRMEPETIDCIHAIQSRTLHMQNTTGAFMEGMLTIDAPEGWLVTPPRSRISLEADECLAIDMEVTPPRSAIAEFHELELRLLVQSPAERLYTMHLPIELSSREIAMDATWRSHMDQDEGCLEISAVIENTSDTVIRLEPFVMGSGFLPILMPPISLGAGERISRTIEIKLPGGRPRMLLAGVRQVDGPLTIRVPVQPIRDEPMAVTIEQD